MRCSEIKGWRQDKMAELGKEKLIYSRRAKMLILLALNL